MIIREATADDVTGIARVHIDSSREAYAGLLDDWWFSDEAYARRLDFWTGFVAEDPRPGRLAVAVDGEVIVGFANAGPATGPDAERGSPPARPLHLFTIYLMASAHGTSLGQGLLDAVIGDEPAQLWVVRGNDRAIRFYRRNRFDFDGAEYTHPERPGVVELRMVR